MTVAEVQRQREALGLTMEAIVATRLLHDERNETTLY